MLTPHEAALLMFRYVRNELTPKEKAQLTAWRQSSAKNEQLFQEETDPENMRRFIRDVYSKKEIIFKKLMARHKPSDEAISPLFPFQGKAAMENRSLGYRIFRIAAILVFSLGSLYLFFSTDIGGTPHKMQHDGNYKAEFINPEGVASVVDDLNRGYADGYKAYKRGHPEKEEEPFFKAKNDPQAAADKYNTLRTPAGAQHGLLLPDGTRVWLNGGTSVKYAAHYSVDSPKITVAGEVYVELTINKNARSQFHVAVGNMQFVTTDGRFHVKAYTGDSLFVTAIDGDLLLDTGSSQPLLLHAHEQAQLIRGKLSVMKNIDIHKIVVWKNNAGKP